MAQEQRISIEIEHLAQLTSSFMPGHIQLRYQKPDAHWQDYTLHIPVSAIQQVNVEPDATLLYLKPVKLSGYAAEGPVELVIPKQVSSSQKILGLLKRVLESEHPPDHGIRG